MSSAGKIAIGALLSALVLAAGVFAFFARTAPNRAIPAVSAANAFIDPNGDGAAGNWSATPVGTRYTTVDDATRQPAVPNTGDYVSAQANNGGSVFFRMSSIPGIAIASEVVVWLYHNDGANGELYAQLFDDNETTTRSSEVAIPRRISVNGWDSAIFSGISLTQAQLDALSVRIRVAKIGGGSPATVFVYAMYGDVTYSTPLPPSITSASDSPDPLVSGSTITFTVNWTDPNPGDQVKAHVCKTDAITNPGQTCTGTSWVDSSAFTSASPITLSYVTTAADIGTQSYFIFVCDLNDLCSASSAGAFQVNPPPPVAPTVSGVTDEPDPVDATSNVIFTVSWNDGNPGDQVKAHVCKTNAMNAATQTCPGGSWADSAAFTAVTPVQLSYLTSAADAGSQNYWAFVCDLGNACSATTPSSTGSFTVNAPPASPPSLRTIWVSPTQNTVVAAPPCPAPSLGAWTTPQNAYNPNEVPTLYAQADVGSGNSRCGQWYGYDFTPFIPAGSVINAVEVRHESYISPNTGNRTFKMYVSADSGAAWIATTDPTKFAAENSEVIPVTSLRAWVDTDFITANLFRVRLDAAKQGANSIFSLDHLPVRVTYTPPTLVVGVTGTQNSPFYSESANSYLGGAFTFNRAARAGTSATLTGVTLTNTGTLNMKDFIARMELKGEYASPCAYDGSEASLGIISNPLKDQFLPGNTAVFSGLSTTVTVGTQFCVYVVVDIHDGIFSPGPFPTLEIQITQPLTDVTVSAGNAYPPVSVAISGTTEVRPATVTVATDGSSQVDLFSPTDNGWVGGRFMFVRTNNTTNVTEITITETSGTINGVTQLSDAKLFWDVTPCSGVTLNQFGTATNFVVAGGVEEATFTGTMPVGIAPVYMCVVLDVAAGIVTWPTPPTVEIEITNPYPGRGALGCPSGDVCVEKGEAQPASAVAIPGPTVIKRVPLVTQRSYIFENDDSMTGVNNNTPQAVFNTPRLNVKKGERLAVRIQIDNREGSETATAQYRLEFCNFTDDPAFCNTATGAWAAVAAAGDIRLALGLSGSSGASLSGSKADSTPGLTTDCQATASHVFDGTDAAWYEATADTASIGLKGYAPAPQCTEVAFMVDTGNAQLGKEYRFRLFNATATQPLDNYIAWPTLTIDTQEARRFSKTTVSALPSGTGDLAYFFDLLGYGDTDEPRPGDGAFDSLNSSSDIPVFLLGARNTNNNSTDSVRLYWVGQSTTANDINFQIYNFAASSWEDIPFSTPCTISPCSLTGYFPGTKSNYYQSATFWTYWRIWQNSGTQTLRTDLVEINFQPSFPPEILAFQSLVGTASVREYFDYNPPNTDDNDADFTIYGIDFGDNGAVTIFGAAAPLLIGDTTCDAGGDPYTQTCIRARASDLIPDDQYIAPNNLVVTRSPDNATVSFGIRIYPRITSVTALTPGPPLGPGPIKVGAPCDGCPQGRPGNPGDAFRLYGNHFCQSPNTVADCTTVSTWSSSITDPDRVEFQYPAPGAEAKVSLVPDAHRQVGSGVPFAQANENYVRLVSLDRPSNFMPFWVINDYPKIQSVAYESGTGNDPCDQKEPIQPKAGGGVPERSGKFCVDWTDPNAGDKAKFWMCKTPDFDITPGPSQGCIGGAANTWLSSSPYKTDDPLQETCDFTAGPPGPCATTLGWHTGYIFLCDQGGLCAFEYAEMRFLVDDRPSSPDDRPPEYINEEDSAQKVFSGGCLNPFGCYEIGKSYRFRTLASDVDGDQIRYLFSCDNNPGDPFGFGVLSAFVSDVSEPISDRTFFVNSGERAIASCQWSTPGAKEIQAITEDAWGVTHPSVIAKLRVDVVGGPNRPPLAVELISPLDRCTGGLANGASYTTEIFPGLNILIRSIGEYRNVRRAIETCYGPSC